MPEPIEQHATVPAQPTPTAPVQRLKPALWVLIALIAIVMVANAVRATSSKKQAQSALTQRPASVSPQQVSSFETQQNLEAKRDAMLRMQQAAAQNAMGGPQSDIPGPEADGAAPMTAAQKQAIYGTSANAPAKTSTASEAAAEAKQRRLAREKAAQDARDSDTVAIDFARPAQAAAGPAPAEAAPVIQQAPGTELAAGKRAADDPAKAVSDPIDGYDGKLYRVFEGTVFEGVVTNHINGSLAGPILVMLTTDYYSHDHQQLLLPQGTRLIGEVQPVSSTQQARLAVVFHRAICPDGFTVTLDKFASLDPLGTSGLSGHVDHGYLQAFGAAAAIGGLGGLAQIGNSGSILTPSSEIRNGISEQSAEEGEQVLNHFLNRLPVITLKEGSRARVYIGRDLLIPSYASHHVDPTL
ncbi:TrbI/VirB10 family protein [Acidipila sp. EB88]|uniref:TrbI/VirB10 family protein n=1 Tax=Acidipila sp. EB88 TaxID=2305226 RepID=UPI000F5E1D92|nr:TrbI/VirB10 family protein [Acidipila sp. EB88]RRA50450.1 TrbI/VirB10 family protein [Acidipila sp. EB88]